LSFFYRVVPIVRFSAHLKVRLKGKCFADRPPHSVIVIGD
jgi:hypothetical protein